MPNTSLQVLNREVQQHSGLGFEEFLTTTTLTTDDQVISTELGDRWNQDDRFNGWFVTIRGTNNDEVVRRVENYVGATGALTVAGAALSAESGSKTCEVSRFHPSDVTRAYNRIRQSVFPKLSAHKDHRGIISDRETLVYPVPTAIRRVDRVFLGRALLSTHSQNILSNSGFEDWDTDTIGHTVTQNNWTVTGASGSASKETQTSAPTNHMVLSGNNSARVRTGSANTTLLQTVIPDVGVEGAYVTMSAYVYCRTANSVACQLDSSSDSPTNGSYHGGTGWELLTHGRKLHDDAADVIAGIYVDAGTTPSESYIDRVLCWAGPVSPPEGLWDVVEGWEHIPPLDGAADGGNIFLAAAPRDHEVLRLVGRGMLSSVSADSDTIEIDGELLDPIYNKIRATLAQEQSGGDPDSTWGRWSREFEMAYREGINGEAVRGARPSLSVNRRGPF